MCTAFTLRSRQGETFLGRNMDFSYDIDPHLYIVPKNYEWDNALSKEKIRNIYCFIGIGQELEGELGFFDGVNEMGFAAVVLYFAGYAQYDAGRDSGTGEQIASKDFLHYILGRCADIDDLRQLLKTISIVGLEDPLTQTVAPLHWMAVDRSGECVVIEQTERGMEVITNPIGVMSNSPDFKWHMTNLRNYMEASPYQSEEAVWGSVRLTPFGQAGGTQSLPGGYTSPERFVRIAYLKSFIPTPESRTEAVVSCVHIMESVSIPKGAVVTSRNSYDYTKYTAFINTTTCEYFFKTYDNIQVESASLFGNCNQFPELVNLGGL
ncbi:choloylglycine hydrolase family protein [Lacrimispora sp. BS-2]|uniref:Choloylglycine hydrolase family protein n=1 Tax=Lacrimispora sp. BS-2 TaxID=3151850 RepID=A0AAU7PKV8_9FIRM